MKKLILISLTLAAASLACLGSAAVAEPTTSPTSATFVKVTEEAAGEVFEIPVLDMTITSQTCAVVIAVEALHVRQGASVEDIVLAWLNNGDVVNVIDQADSDWWRIERDGIVGFARSIYLQERTC